MGELIDIREILAVRREVTEHDREEREKFLAALERIRPFLLDLRIVLKQLQNVGLPLS